MGSIWKAGNFIRSKNYIVFMHFLQNHSSRSSALQPSTLANANKLPALALFISFARCSYCWIIRSVTPDFSDSSFCERPTALRTVCNFVAMFLRFSIEFATSTNFSSDASCNVGYNFWTTPPDGSDEDSVAAVRISHIGMHWNRDLVQSYAFPNFADILRCFVSQEQDWPSAVRPPPHCIIRLIHIQKVVTKGQDLQLQFYIVFGLPWLKSL